MDLALLDSIGGRLQIVADGITFVSWGDGLILSDAQEVQLVPGEMDHTNFGVSLRNRRYHELMFVCSSNEVVLVADGYEKRPVKKGTDENRGFRIVADKIDLDMKDFQVSFGDRRGTWSSRNMIVNGGFEDLCNGYPVCWTTYNFGFGRSREIANIEETRANYRIDDTVAYEGRNSMLLACNVPLWETWAARPPNLDYVFSVYAKAATPDAKVKLMAFDGYKELGGRKFDVGMEWTRLQLPFHYATGRLRCGIEKIGDGKVWVDAAQLEKGSSVTPFVTHPVAVEEVPPNPPKVMDHYYAKLRGSRPSSGNPPRMSRVDPKRNSFRFGDKEFFAYGYSSVLDWKDWDNFLKALDRYAEWGINLNAFGPGHAHPEDPVLLRKLLDESEKRGVKTMFYLAVDRKTFRIKESQLQALKAVADHPNILGVDMLDELGAKVPMETRQALADRIRRELGGQVPIQSNEYDLGVITRQDYSPVDIASVDLYVTPGHEVSSLYYILRQFRDDNPDQVVTYYPMAAGSFASWQRDPTPAEVLAQAYIAYVLEIYNLKWWQGVPLTALAQEAVTQARRERDIIDPSAFLDGMPVEIGCESRNDAVKFTARRLKNGVVRLVAINIENRPNDAEWRIPFDVRQLTIRIGDGNQRLSVGKTLREKFQPLERRVYDLL